MKSFPILPIWLMAIISIVYIILIIKTKNKYQLINRILIIVLLFIINLRFMISGGKQEVYQSNYDIFLVVDNTISMVAEDYQGTNRRIDAVKEDLKYILDKLPSSNYSVITYDNSSYIRAPLTTDRDTIDVIIDTMSVKLSYYATGSTISIFKDDLEYLLNNSKKKGDHKRIVFIVSDGENTSKEKIESLSSLKGLVDGGAVLGYGTLEGGYMQELPYSSAKKKEYILDKRNSYPYPKAISKIDENTLKKFASELGIEYVHMNKQTDIDNLLYKIISNSQLNESSSLDNYQDTYFPFAIVLTVLLLVELYYDKRKYI